MKCQIRITAVLLALLAIGGCTRSSSSPSEPAVVDLAYVDPSTYFSYSELSVGLADGVVEAHFEAQGWCSEHPDVCVGAVRRPEATYIGLTRDHEKIVQSLRRGLAHPERLRAFKALYSLSELREVNMRTVHDFLLKRAPDKVGRFVVRYIVAMSKVLIEVEDMEPDLARALKDEFGDKIATFDPIGRVGGSVGNPLGVSG